MSNLLFMHDFYTSRLPTVFNDFFFFVSDKHKYTTRLATTISYCIPIVRTNYGKFSIRSQGPYIWNDIDDSLKILTKSVFKKKIKIKFINLMNTSFIFILISVLICFQINYNQIYN